MKYYAVFVGRTPGIYTTWSDCSAQVTKFPGARFKGYPSDTEAIKAYNEYGGGVNKPIPVPVPASPPHGDADMFAVQTGLLKSKTESHPLSTSSSLDEDDDNVILVRTTTQKRAAPSSAFIASSTTSSHLLENQQQHLVHRDVQRIREEEGKKGDDERQPLSGMRPMSPDEYDELDKDEYHTPCLVVDAACTNSRNGVGEYRGIWIRADKKRAPAFTSGQCKPATNNVMEFLAAVEGLQMVYKQQVPQCVVYTDSHVALAWVNRMEIKQLTKNILMEINMPLMERVGLAECWLAKHKHVIKLLRKWDTRKWGEIPADYGRK